MQPPIRDVVLTLLLITLAHHTSCENTSNLTCSDSSSPFVSAEKRLHKCLLSDLDATVRPAKQPSDTVTVSLDIITLKLLNLDEKSHVITTAGWIKQSWTDFQLSWKPEDYEGIKSIRLPVERLWTPDIVLVNSVDDSYTTKSDNLAIVTYNGTVTYLPQARLRSYCDLDFTRFPFDTQACIIAFGSWTYDTSVMNITMPTVTAPKNYWNGKEWEIVKMTSERKEWSPRKKVQVYAGVITTLTVKRASSFYQYLFVMPTVLLAFLTLLIPCVEPRTNERITYCIALVLGCVLVLLMLEENLPSEMGTVPVVAAYLAYLMVILCMLLLLSIVVTNMCHRDSKQGKVPGWLRWMFLTKLNKLVCVPAEPYTALPLEFAVDESNFERELLDMRNGTSDLQAPDTKTQLERTLEDIRRYLRVVASRSGAVGGAPSHAELIVQEWLQVAKVTDRLTFVSLCVLTIVITISMYSHY